MLLDFWTGSRSIQKSNCREGPCTEKFTLRLKQNIAKWEVYHIFISNSWIEINSLVKIKDARVWFFFSIVWCSHTDNHPWGIIQICYMSEKESKNISEPCYIMVTCRNLLPKYDDSRKKKIPPNLATLDNSFHKYPMYELALDYLWSPSEEDLLKSYF